MLGSIEASNPVLIFLSLGIFAAVTVSVLLGMDVLECFLHALRLHWVRLIDGILLCLYPRPVPTLAMYSTSLMLLRTGTNITLSWPALSYTHIYIYTFIYIRVYA